MFRRQTVRRYAPIVLLITLLNYYIIWNWTGFEASNRSVGLTLHVGIVITHHSECRTIPLLVKSVLMHRNGPIHFHFLSDGTSQGILQEIFQTWDLPSTVAHFHLLEDHPNRTRLSTGALKLQLVRYLPSSAQKIILMGPRVIVLADIDSIWRESIESNKAMSEFQNKIDTIEKSEVLLLKTESIPGPYVSQSKRMTMYLPHSNTHTHCLSTIGNHTNCRDNEILRVLSERGKGPSKNTIENIISFDGYQIQEQNTIDKRNGTEPWFWSWICCDFYLHRHRVHPFFMGQVHHSLDIYDVTMVVQLSWDRLDKLKMMLEMWSGPMSASLYVEDAEIPEIIQTIPPLLLQRGNVAIHVVYKNQRSKYPINFLRNLAWRHANTPYVFLNDIDFIPNPDTYSRLRHALQRHPLGSGAFVVPAFRTNIKDLDFPKSKQLLETLVLERKITPFREGDYDRLHGPTDYKQWFKSSESYIIEWKYDYEPYVVVSHRTSGYDERFVGYGRNKISHIEELHAQDYTFTVLPDVYTIHYPHALTTDRIAFMRLLTAVTASRYFICIALLDMAFEEDLKQKYGYIRVDPWH